MLDRLLGLATIVATVALGVVAFLTHPALLGATVTVLVLGGFLVCAIYLLATAGQDHRR